MAQRSRRARIETLESRLFFHIGEVAGTGLLGQYFDNKDFTAAVFQRTDATVSFNWAYNAPAAGMGADTFSIRWTGQLIAHTTESYTFHTTSDDGVRLWINGKLVIDKLINQSATTYKTAPIALTAGQPVDIRLDYFDNGGQAKVQLMWSTPTIAKQIVPQDHLFPGAPPPPTPPPPPPAPTAIRIDAAGSKNYTDADGKTWSADKYYSGGSTSLGLFAISGTTDDVMYATRRFGKSFSYAIPVTPGDYKVNLLFADESFAAGGRLINVSAEGQQILKNFDIVGEAGKGVALVKSFDITSDGTLNLAFTGVLQNATLSAIEIVPVIPGPATSWQTVAPSPVQRAEAVGGVIGGKLYVFGGYYSAAGHIPAYERSDAYDPATNQWTPIADQPQPGGFTHSGIAIDGDTFWFLGQYSGEHPGPGSVIVWKYNTTTNEWSRGPDLPEARGAGAAAIVGRTLHFVGGMDETRTTENGTHWSLDLDDPSASWIERAAMPNPRNHLGAAGVGGYLYAIGGQHGQEGEQNAQSDVHRYDPATDTWTAVTSLPEKRSHIVASTFVMDGKIIVLGGETAYEAQATTVFSYDPATNAWATIGMLPAARSTSVAGAISATQFITSSGNGPYETDQTWIGLLI